MLTQVEAGETATRSTRRLRYSDPLFRNGHALIASSIGTSVVGFVFWVFAAHGYTTNEVGRNAAAISALTFIGGVAQFNLAGALVRFIPLAGKGTRRFVLGTYGVAVITSILLTAVFVGLVPSILPKLDIFRADWRLLLFWAIGTSAWSIFNLEDGALTGLKLAIWVPVENLGFSLVKVALVLPLAIIAPRIGIFLAWTVATVVTILPTNLFLFRTAIPRAERLNPDLHGVPTGQLMRYVPYDFLASMSWLGAIGLSPILVLRNVGPTESAYFSLAWVIAYAFYLMSINMGSSMMVETARDQSQLQAQCRRVRHHLLKTLVPLVLVTVVAAPEILRLFGHAYSDGATTTLRLLVASAVPFIYTATEVAALRSRERTRPVFVINAVICVMALALTWELSLSNGVVGAGIAWLVTQCVVALGLGISRALAHDTGRSSVGRIATSAELWLARIAAQLRISSRPHPLRDRKMRREAEALVSDALGDIAERLSGGEQRAEDFVAFDIVPGGSDVTVVRLRCRDREPFAMLKFPRTPEARCDLEAHCGVIKTLEADERVQAWHFLPATRLIQDAHSLFAVEPLVRGVDGQRLLARSPRLRSSVATSGLEVVGELHKATLHYRQADADFLDPLLYGPLDTLLRSHPSGIVPMQQRLAIENVRRRLEFATLGRQLNLGWTHGDFTAGNVIFSGDGSQIHAVLDWGQARPDGIPALDVVSWLCSLEVMERGRRHGNVVCDLLGRPEWPTSGTFALGANAISESGIEGSELVLWFWLLHVAGNLNKAQRYVHNPLWWVTTVEPVLKAVGT